MNILKTGLMVVVAVMSLAQTSNAKAEGMNLYRYYEEESQMNVSWLWAGNKEVWVGKYVGKDHRLVTVDFQGAHVGFYTASNLQSVGARIDETRYYSNTGYVYAKVVLDSSTFNGVGRSFRATVNYSVSVYDGTSATNARSSY